MLKCFVFWAALAGRVREGLGLRAGTFWDAGHKKGSKKNQFFFFSEVKWLISQLNQTIETGLLG
jgi:hypothetical protein